MLKLFRFCLFDVFVLRCGMNYGDLYILFLVMENVVCAGRFCIGNRYYEMIELWW